MKSVTTWRKQCCGTIRVGFMGLHMASQMANAPAAKILPCPHNEQWDESWKAAAKQAPLEKEFRWEGHTPSPGLQQGCNAAFWDSVPKGSQETHKPSKRDLQQWASIITWPWACHSNPVFIYTTMIELLRNSCFLILPDCWPEHAFSCCLECIFCR